MSSDISALFAGLLPTQGTGVVAATAIQPAELTSENSLSPFLESFQVSLQALLDQTLPGADPQVVTAALGDVLRQAPASGGHLLPLEATAASDALIEQIRVSLQQAGVLNNAAGAMLPALQTAPETLADSAAPTPATGPLTVSYAPDEGLAQTQMPDPGLTRLLERLQISLNTLPPAAEATAAPITTQNVAERRLVINSSNTLLQPGAGQEAPNEAADEILMPGLRENVLMQNTAAPVALNPLLFERQLMAFSAKRQSGTELLNSSDQALDPLAALQSSQAVQAGRVMTAPGPAADGRVQQGFISTPLHDPQWQSELGNRVMMLARGTQGQAQVAEIRLNPQHLGPVEIRVVMNDDQATVTFTAQHGAVRDAIESSLPRLREMFTSSGLMLADAQVSDQSLHQRRQHEERNSAKGQAQPGAGFGLDDETERLIGQIDLSTTPSLRALDLYA